MKNTVQRYGLFVYLQGLEPKKGAEEAPFMHLLHLFDFVARKLLTTVCKISILRTVLVL